MKGELYEKFPQQFQTPSELQRVAALNGSQIRAKIPPFLGDTRTPVSVQTIQHDSTPIVDTNQRFISLTDAQVSTQSPPKQV